MEGTETLINEATTESTNTETQTLISETPGQTESQDNQQSTNANAVEEAIEYQDFSLPEGFTLDAEVGAEFKSIAKELKLNQEQAQKLVDMHTKHTKFAQEKLDSEFKGIVSDWRQEAVTHFGKGLQSELSYVAKALDKYGSPEMKILLNDTGLGNNKNIISFLGQIGRRLSDDKIVNGNTQVEEVSFAKKLYPNMN
jgi:hypothetical protein